MERTIWTPQQLWNRSRFMGIYINVSIYLYGGVFGVVLSVCYWTLNLGRLIEPDGFDGISH